nr:MarR family transcriptional regulator [candidate division Zixibacteria bacterium]
MENRKDKLGEVLLRILNKYVDNQKKPRHYGLEEFLYPAEVHLITLIGPNPGLGVTDLAKRGGVTRGAISQMAQKLVNKGLITKKQDPGSGTRVIFELTNKGKIAFYSHQRMHDDVDRELLAFVESLRPEQFRILVRFLDLFEQGIDKRSET